MATRAAALSWLVSAIAEEGWKVQHGLPMLEWCALLTDMEPKDLLQRCCQPDSHSCFELADAIGGKCCRQETSPSGFYGFLLPPRSFSLNGKLHQLDPCAETEAECLFSWGNFHILGPKLEEELDALGFLGDETGPALSMKATTSPILMDLVRVNSHDEEVPIFYHRLFHEYAEVTPQALWEYSHYTLHRNQFLASLAARPRVAKRGAVCGQPEAAQAKAMADTTALPWLALRWMERGNEPFDSFVNLGARDGLADDPLQFLLRDPRHVEFALAVEMDPEYCSRHRANLPHVVVLCLRVSQQRMPEILKEVPDWRLFHRREVDGMPRLDVLKVDLDGADCDAARAFLTSVRAKLVVLEVFDGLPPPLRFALHEHPELRWGELKIWGCSLSYQVRMLKPLGYHLVWYGAGNAVYVHSTAKRRLGLPRLDEVDCYAKSVVMAVWPNGRTLRRWFYEDPLNLTLSDARRALGEHLQGRPYTLML